MGRFFNKTRTPLSASTTKGNAITFPPRGWAYVPINEESSQAIQTYVRKGLLARAEAPEDEALLAAAAAPVRVPVKVAPPVAPVAAVAVVPAVEAKPVAEEVGDLSGGAEAIAEDEDSITSNVSAEVRDPFDESVAPDSPPVADSLPRKPRRR
jgi:hypothetical protein